VTVLSIIGCVLSLIFTTGISSYLVGIVDGFVNEFGILLLIAIQCIIFTWIYDADSLIPVLNENSRFKVGKTWKFIIKYILPLVLIIMWLIGIIQLFENANSFEIAVDIIIMVVVLALSVIFTRIKPKES
jgi:NSS family neurotransmitter:Na+ symporter